MYPPRTDFVDFVKACNCAFTDDPDLPADVSRARNLWIETRTNEHLEKYKALWLKLAERTRREPWKQSKEAPFGFAWSSIENPDDVLYVQCLTYETLNLSGVRAVNLCRCVLGEGTGAPVTVMEEEAAQELQRVAREALDAIAGWRNLTPEVAELSLVCNVMFWYGMETTATCFLALRDLDARGEAGATKETLDAAGDFPAPASEFNSKTPRGDHSRIRDSAVRLLRMRLLELMAGRFEADPDTLGLACACTTEHVRIAREDLAHCRFAKSHAESLVSLWARFNPFGIRDAALAPAEARLAAAEKKKESLAYIMRNFGGVKETKFDWKTASNRYLALKSEIA